MSHYDDEAQVAELKKWWNENWMALAAGLVIGLSAILGWQYWQSYETRRAMQASQIYEDMKKAQTGNKLDEATKLGEKLLTDFAATPYATSAALRLAALAVDAAKFDEAASRLNWVLSHGKEDPLKPVARLRLARVLWAQNKNDEALKTLDGDAGDYAALFEELRGDLQLAKGDRAAARAAYEKALTAASDSPASKTSLQQKLDDLADVTSAS